jgi:hypothetical protein
MSKHLFAAALSAAFFLSAAAVAEVPTEGIGTYEVAQADTKDTNEKAAQDPDASRKADDKAVVEEKAGEARSSTAKSIILLAKRQPIGPLRRSLAVRSRTPTATISARSTTWSSTRMET